jgi:hypothetical protein
LAMVIELWKKQTKKINPTEKTNVSKGT